MYSLEVSLVVGAAAGLSSGMSWLPFAVMGYGPPDSLDERKA